MAKIDGIFDNFANHVTSGLSMFVMAAYDACAAARTTTVLAQLLPEVQVPEAFSADVNFGLRVAALRGKFEETPSKQSKMSLDQITNLAVELDFQPNADRARERRREMMRARLYYGYNPVYRCTVSMRLTSGRERVAVMTDS